MKRTILFFLAILVMLIAQNLYAQEKEKEATEITNQILTARKTSNELLRNYFWNSRTEVVKSKEILNIMIENNKYDPDGQLVQKALNYMAYAEAIIPSKNITFQLHNFDYIRD